MLFLRCHFRFLALTLLLQKHIIEILAHAKSNELEGRHLLGLVHTWHYVLGRLLLILFWRFAPLVFGYTSLLLLLGFSHCMVSGKLKAFRVRIAIGYLGMSYHQLSRYKFLLRTVVLHILQREFLLAQGEFVEVIIRGGVTGVGDPLAPEDGVDTGALGGVGSQDGPDQVLGVLGHLAGGLAPYYGGELEVRYRDLFQLLLHLLAVEWQFYT